MDWVSFTVTCAVNLVLAPQRGEALAPLVERHNTDFRRSYSRWAEAIYHGKYHYIGEYDLMCLAFLLDLGLYYLGVASQPFKRGVAGLREPVFTTKPSVPFYHLMRTYNRRLARIAQSRRARGVLGKTNHCRRFLFGGYTFAPSSGRPILRALLRWGILELKEGWRSWFRAATANESVPVEGVKIKPAPYAMNPAGNP
jgi:hypothetical protein